MKMKISAIVCTHNGQRVLGNALQSLTSQTLSTDDYEVVVVDNASTDGTKQIAKQFQVEKNFRYILEPTLGLSHARNTGWEHAQGEIIAYLDDDAIACPEWLDLIVNAFQSVPEAGAVGGRVDPIWEAPRPAWLSDNMTRALSLINWSESPIFLDKEQWLVGANISFPRKLLVAVGGFSSDLGRRGKCLLSNEENLLVSKIRAQGCTVYYDPKIRVQHIIPKERLSKKWFRRRYYWQGISDAILQHSGKKLSTTDKFILVRSQIKQLILIYMKSIFLMFPSNNEEIWDEKRIAYYRLGTIRGLLKIE